MVRRNPLSSHEISEYGVFIVNYLREYVHYLYWLPIIDTLHDIYRGREKSNPEQGEPDILLLSYHVARIIEYLDSTPMTNSEIIKLLEKIKGILLTLLES